jgi:hypothetical protein
METTDHIPPPSQPFEPPIPYTPHTEASGFVADVWSFAQKRSFPELIVNIVAVFGGGLVMAAAVAAAAAKWGTLSVTIRLIMLTAVLVAITAASELLSKRIPTVGRVLIHLSAFLVLPTAIASTAQLHGTWRVCTVVGGIAAGVAVWAQGRRKQAPLLTGSTAIAAMTSAAGVAAITHAPIGALIGGLAVGALMIGWERRATLLAASAAAVPVTAVLAKLQIGPGTLRELGAVGPHLSLGAVIGGTLAAGVLVWIGRSKRSAEYYGAAAAAFGTALLGAGDLFDVSRIRYLIPGIVFICTQIIVKRVERSEWVKPSWEVPLIVDILELISCIPLLLIFTRNTLASTVGGVLVAIGFALGAFRKRELPVQLPIIAASAFAAIASGMHFAPVWGFWTFATVSALMFFIKKEHSWLAVSASMIPLAATLHLRWLGMNHATIAFIVGIASFVVIGASAAIRPKLQPASIAGMFGLLIAATQLHGSWINVGIVIAGLVIASFAVLIDQRALEFGGFVIVGLAGAGLALTSAWSVDVRAAAVVGVLIIAELGFRRLIEGQLPIKLTWFLPSISVGVLYLFSQLSSADYARLGWIVAIGVAAIAIGAIAQHRPLLYSGIGLTAFTIVVASAEQLKALPVWVWAMVGGLGLLVLAGFLETRRSHRNAISTTSN